MKNRLLKAFLGLIIIIIGGEIMNAILAAIPNEESVSVRGTVIVAAVCIIFFCSKNGNND
ncbi:MAG: hypothetical protein IJR95_09630 [Lachnospiraceae bacterium]|nr:hypothetical protein [Lachnospiraceae bacterium]